MIFTAIFIYLYDLLIFKLLNGNFVSDGNFIDLAQNPLSTSRMPKNSMKIVLSAKKKLTAIRMRVIFCA